MRALNKFNNATPFLVALVVASAVFVLTKVFFQNTTYRVLIKGFFEHDTLVTIYSTSDSGHSAALDSFMVKGKAANKLQYEGSKVMNLPMKNLKLEFAYKGESEQLAHAKFHLAEIQILKPYQKRYYFSGKNIGNNFSSDQGIDKTGKSYKYDTTNGQASLSSINAIGGNNWSLILGLSGLFFICVFFLARNTSILALPAFSDMSLGNHISSSGEFDTINGLRGLAALLVLLSHTAPGFEALQMGLAFLFVISGFLLSKPFVLNSKKIFSWSNIEHYVSKRLRRILPMYYLYIFLIYVMTFQFDTAIRHFFFVQSAGHLWPMTQIFAFYMMLPLILILTSAAYKLHRVLPIAVLGVASYASVTLMAGWKPFYNGSYSHEFFLYAFLIGVLISYVQYDLIGKPGVKPWGQRWSREIIGIIAALITFYIIAWSAPMKPSPIIFQWVSQFWVKCIVSALIILLALNTPKTIYQGIISNWLFRSVGVIGFSFYILHGLGMQIFEQLQIQYLGSANPGGRSWVFMIGAFCITYPMSVIAYSFVERPFFGYRVKK